MQCMLDTNHCIYEMTGRAGYKAQVPPDACGISVIVLGELEFGVCKSVHRQRNRDALNAFVSMIAVIPLAPDTARLYGALRAHLEEEGTKIGTLDTWIAAHALALEVPLITHNAREFSRVPNLVIDSWMG